MTVIKLNIKALSRDNRENYFPFKYSVNSAVTVFIEVKSGFYDFNSTFSAERLAIIDLAWYTDCSYFVRQNTSSNYQRERFRFEA